MACLEARAIRKRYIGRLVHHFITAVSFEEHPEFAEPLIRYRVRLATAEGEFLKVLQNLVVAQVIRSPEVQHLEFKGQGMVVAVFEALQSDPARLLPRDALMRLEAGAGMRAICDYVASMTDTHLLKIYERLFSPRMGSVFDKF